MKNSDHIGVGLISVGWMGRLHSRAYRAASQHFLDLPQPAELVIAADPDDSGRHHAEKALGFAETTSDYHELLEHPDVDVVSICAPNYLHHQIALDTIAAGKPFWIEKPMGRNATESREIAQEAAEAGLITSVGFNYRHAPAIAEARRLVREGTLGRVTNVQVRFMADYASDPNQVFTWRFETERAGSGAIGDLLSHGFDLAQYVVGRITELTALTDTFIPDRPLPLGTSANRFEMGEVSDQTRAVENEDYTAMLARFGNGAVGVFESTRVAVGPHAEYSIEVYGTEGSLRWDFQRLNELQLADDRRGYRTIMADNSFGEFRQFQPSPGTSMGFDDLKTVEAGLFLRSVAENRQLSPSVADGWSAAEIADAALRSAKSREWIEVPQVDENTTYHRETPQP
jgi:predicted dehydrogenase